MLAAVVSVDVVSVYCIISVTWLQGFTTYIKVSILYSIPETREEFVDFFLFFFFIPPWNSNNKLKNRYRTVDNTQNQDMLKYS